MEKNKLYDEEIKGLKKKLEEEIYKNEENLNKIQNLEATIFII